MQHNENEKRNELILLGHLCSIRIRPNELNIFFSYLAKYSPKCSLIGTQIGEYFFISMYFKTTEQAKNIYDLLLNWNP